MKVEFSLRKNEEVGPQRLQYFYFILDDVGATFEVTVNGSPKTDRRGSAQSPRASVKLANSFSVQDSDANTRK